MDFFQFYNFSFCFTIFLTILSKEEEKKEWVSGDITKNDSNKMVSKAAIVLYLQPPHTDNEYYAIN